MDMHRNCSSSKGRRTQGLSEMFKAGELEAVLDFGIDCCRVHKTARDMLVGLDVPPFVEPNGAIGILAVAIVEDDGHVSRRAFGQPAPVGGAQTEGEPGFWGTKQIVMDRLV